MNKASKTFSAIALSLVVSGSVHAAPSVIPDPPNVAAKGYILMDYHSGEILAASNENERLKPASLTKMMTSYVIGQEVSRGNISLDDDVVISENAWARNFPGSSKMYIEVGKTVKVADLNRGIIIQSGNDACVAMAEHVAGSEDSFVGLMNGWAKTLGMENTHFTNSHGLDSKNIYSTPYDLALLSQALIRDVPEEYAIYKEKAFSFNNIPQYNRNGLLWDKSLNVDGIKTGHTDGAGYNLVSSATEGRMRLISVVMGTQSTNARKAESKKLLNYGFRFFDTVSPHKAADTFASERVWMGDKENIALGVAQDTFVTVHRGKVKNLKSNFKLHQTLEAPLKKGDVVGTLYYQLDDDDIADFPLIALEDIEEGGFFTRMKDTVILFVKGLF
ncbi:D-alanyl-D-alanine carboxypeptidase [Veronia nyctiphanis]|uniref:serine-type D-Ala-D-Ala carboxypeptidase n=1 Tax=Veronia nyctiphanis TaxID=1278244 RepID=A0A4Q0YSJ1_9GAMM|nr:serine hydrolase [Veronia nyctiphanis]RXJ73094.1 D-alanyl-D-alanine carboxypeptidase [Veronia nyctiphanis]